MLSASDFRVPNWQGGVLQPGLSNRSYGSMNGSEADALGSSPPFGWKVAHGKIRTPVFQELRRCLVSSDSKFLRLIQQGAVSRLREGEDKR